MTLRPFKPNWPRRCWRRFQTSSCPTCSATTSNPSPLSNDKTPFLLSTRSPSQNSDVFLIHHSSSSQNKFCACVCALTVQNSDFFFLKGGGLGVSCVHSLLFSLLWIFYIFTHSPGVIFFVHAVCPIPSSSQNIFSPFVCELSLQRVTFSGQSFCFMNLYSVQAIRNACI